MSEFKVINLVSEVRTILKEAYVTECPVKRKYLVDKADRKVKEAERLLNQQKAKQGSPL